MAREMKANQHVQPVVDVAAGTVTFNVKGYDPIILHADKLHADIMRRAALVGMAQVRIVDAAAVGMADDEGNIIPEADRIALKHKRMAELVSHYETGTAEWSRAGTGIGGGKSITLEAIARIKAVEYDQAEAWVAEYAASGKDDKGRGFEGDTKKALAYLRQGKRVAETIEAIRAERMPSPKIDADAALEALK